MRDGRKGFTLIEIVIVIVVVGVLAAMMMMSSKEAESSARVQNIINNFNQLHKAVNAWYLDNQDRVRIGVKGSTKELGIRINGQLEYLSTFIGDKGGDAEILRYIQNKDNVKIVNHNKPKTENVYILRAAENGKIWYISYYLGNADSQVKSKFAGRAKSMELFGSSEIKNFKCSSFYKNDDYISMEVLSVK